MEKNIPSKGNRLGEVRVCSDSAEPELRFWNLLWVGVGRKKTLHEVWEVQVNVALFVVR